MDYQPASLTRHFNLDSNFSKIFIAVILLTLLTGLTSGYFLSSGNKGLNAKLPVQDTPKTAQQDTKTFRDFAEGTLQRRPDPKKPGEYFEGTHILVRDGAVPVALTSSVVDLSLYEGKKVKVYGETQKALKEGWLMDVGKVEEVQ